MSHWTIGIDLGATKIALGLVSPDNRIVAREQIATLDGQGPERVVARIADCVEKLTLALPIEAELDAVGICCPGPVDHMAGSLIDPPNIPGLQYAPLGPMLQTRLGVPVALEHDAKAAALGEFHSGAGRDDQDMVYVVVGTGVGAAVIIDGQLFRGCNDTAGEVGHVTLNGDGPLCHCGSHGCVETYLAGPWLGHHYQLRSGSAVSNITGERVAERAAQGDAIALEVLDQAGNALGTAVATMAMLFGVHRYVIGGSVAQAGDLLLGPARKQAPKCCYRSVGHHLDIVQNELGIDGPILGCAWLARQSSGLAESAR